MYTHRFWLLRHTGQRTLGRLSDRNGAGNDALIAKVDDIENRSQRNNLFLYGIEDNDEHDRATKSEGRVTKLCELHMGIKYVSTEKAHRLGKFSRNKKRPLIVKFACYKEKQSVLLKARKFKGTNISIS